jgi:hypothetical protein
MNLKKRGHAMAQLHKRFTDSQVKELLSRYLRGEIKRAYLQEVLGIKQRRFWELVKRYQQGPSSFSINYARRNPTRAISPAIEKNILKELSIEKKLIVDNTSLCAPTTTAISKTGWKPLTIRKCLFPPSSTGPRRKAST